MLQCSDFVQLKYKQETDQVWCETPWDTNFNTSQCVKNYKALHPCSQGNTSSHLIVNKQMLLHKAIGLVGPECCQDVAVAAVRKHAHSVPQGGLQRCIGEQALQKLHPGS